MDIERLLNGISVAHRNETVPQEMAEYAELVYGLSPIHPAKLTKLITYCTERLKTRPRGVPAILWPSLVMEVDDGTHFQTRITREKWDEDKECLLVYSPELYTRYAHLKAIAVPFDAESNKPFGLEYVMRGMDFWPPRIFNEGSQMRDMTWYHDR